nr:hypothetical protein [Tanacetum cinerariifolium]
MIAYLTKSDASEGFNQIIDFLNGILIKYALTVNPNIYVPCIKHFWTSVTVKKVNDVMRLQALVDKKKVIVFEATIREALRLDDAEDDAEGIECLPNKEIFAELERMGYEKLSTKLNFYKAFFSSQWKFLIHTILQCMSAKQTSWNKFSSSMASDVICLSSSRKFNFSKKQVGKGFSGVDTSLFEGMLVAQEVGEDANEVHAKDVNTDGVVAEGAASDDVNAAVDELSIPSPQPPTPPPQPSQDIPSNSQDARISMDLIQNLMDTCTTLSRRVEHLELDKIAQALEITKLKQRVKKLERIIKLKDVVLEDAKDAAVKKSADVEDNAD